MIAKGTPHSNGARLGRYLITGKEDERATLHELRGFADDNIIAAFKSVHVISRATKCEQPFFHCQVRNPAGEHLTRQQWELVANRIESKLGLTDQPRAISFHEKGSDKHMHIAWSRIDDATMTVKPLPFYKLRLKEVCRELEIELGLTRVRNHRELNEPRAPSRAEFEQARRRGIDLNKTRAAIRSAWERSDTGSAFVAALQERGLTLAQGDQRDFVVVDGHGGIHALGKRLLGVSAAETRRRLADLNRDAVPTLAVGKTQAGRSRAVGIAAIPIGNHPDLVIRTSERSGDERHASYLLYTPDLTQTVTVSAPRSRRGEEFPTLADTTLEALLAENLEAAIEPQKAANDRAAARRQLADHIAAEAALSEREREASLRRFDEARQRARDLDRA